MDEPTVITRAEHFYVWRRKKDGVIGLSVAVPDPAHYEVLKDTADRDEAAAWAKLETFDIKVEESATYISVGQIFSQHDREPQSRSVGMVPGAELKQYIGDLFVTGPYDGAGQGETGVISVSGKSTDDLIHLVTFTPERAAQDQADAVQASPSGPGR